MNKLDTDYQFLLNDILANGTKKEDRTGTGTISVFGRTIRHKMSDGFPLLTTKKLYMKGIVTELIWFLKGRTDLKYLLDNNCNIWVGDAYKKYQEEWMKENPPFSKYFDDILSVDEFIGKIKTDETFSKRFGDLGPIYGKQWRKWQGYLQYKKEDGSIGFGSLWHDQIAILIHSLKTNPDSRRLMVNAWAVDQIDKMILPPCHYGFQIYTRELTWEERLRLANYDKEKFNSIDEWITWYNNEPSEFCFMGINYTRDTALTDLGIPSRAISLQWNQRSVDTFLGLPFNIASYGLLLIILARATNMVPEELIGNLGDTHLYSNHIDAAKEQMTRESFSLPQLETNSGNENWQLLGIDEILDSIDIDLTFKLKNYQSHPTIKAPLNN